MEHRIRGEVESHYGHFVAGSIAAIEPGCAVVMVSYRPSREPPLKAYPLPHMDISANDLKFIKRCLLNNTAVLFTGAGFSRDALNLDSKPIPAGEELCDLLWSYLGYSGARSKETLQRLYEVALTKGYAPLSSLLKSTFKCQSYAAWYRVVPAFYWYRIYSTNIDDVLEKAYLDSAVTRLRVINGQKDDYTERDQFLSTIQYVKLNGVDWISPKDVTFSFRQYAKRAGDSPVWYEQLARDFATRPIIFVGTELDEQLLWAAVELRGRKIGGAENRPQSFWIKPKFSPADIDALEQFNVKALPGTAREFFEQLAAATDSEKRQAEVIATTHPGMALLVATVKGDLNNRRRQILEDFYSVLRPVVLPDRVPEVRKSFLMGAAPEWPSLYRELDAARVCTAQLVARVEEKLKQKDLSILSVTGYAGSGKSTTLMRAALALRAKGILVLYADGETFVHTHVFSQAMSLIGSRCVLIFDGASRMKTLLADYFKVCKASGYNPVILIADRTNTLNHFESTMSKDYPLEAFRIPNLCKEDIETLLDKLEDNGLLGKLQGLSRAQQVYQFSIRAGKQILIAMREATSGHDFDSIIESEFESVEAGDDKIVYCAVCLATAAGYTLSAQQFVALSNREPNDALASIDGVFQDIIVSIGGKRSAFLARHRVIATLVVDKLAARETVQESYIRLLQVLSVDIPKNPRSSDKAFRLYREIINHTVVWRRFQQSLLLARGVFDVIREYFRGDPHYWLQYGSLELEFGELELAEVYIASAESLSPEDDFVLNTKAFLYYKRAIASDKISEAGAFRAEARDILQNHIRRHTDDVYAGHIMCGCELKYIRTWMTKLEQKKEAFEQLRKDIAACISGRPYSERLAELKKEIDGAYLELALY